jgi:hypothetical protein
VSAVGKKHDKDSAAARKINVEIAPGNQAKLDVYIDAYNGRPDRSTPKIKYTDVVNDALDKYFEAQEKVPRTQPAAAKRK